MKNKLQITVMEISIPRFKEEKIREFLFSLRATTAMKFDLHYLLYHPLSYLLTYAKHSIL